MRIKIIFLFFSLLQMISNCVIASTFDLKLKLTKEEVQWLKENKNKIRYAPNPSWPPGDYIEDNEHKGIVSDYIKIFEDKLGITFSRSYFNSWPDIIFGLKKSEADFVGAMQKTKERKQYLIFTEPFLTTRIAVLVRKNSFFPNSLDYPGSMTLACVKGYSSTEYVRVKYPEAEIVECLDDLSALLKVSSGAADGAVIDFMVASYLVDKYSITNIKFGIELDFHWKLRFAVRKDMPHLRSILDKVLNTIGEKQRHQIYQRWVSINLERHQNFFERHQKIIIAIFLSTLVLLFIVLLFNVSLKKQVLARTMELKTSADQLRESKEYLQAVLDSAGDAVFVNDADTGGIIDVNNRMCEMYGYSYEDALRVDMGELSLGEPPFSQADALEWLRKARETGPQTFDWLALHKDRYTFWVEVKICFAVIGAANRFVVVVRDISERKRTEEQLLKSQKLESLGILAGGIAHDFNNLLGGIFGNIDLAAECTRENNTAQYLSKAMSTIERARALTRQLLTFSKGGIPIQKIGSLFPYIQEIAQFALSGSNVVCRFNVPHDLWTCNFDKNQVGQVIENLIINAQQAMPEGGKIDVAARNIVLEENEHPLLPKGKYVKISVKDSGVGIPNEIISKIFDPFFTTKSKGHGLGLATSHSIIHRHNGYMNVESEVGKGSVFYIYLPATGETGLPLIKSESKQHKGKGTILVMDDEVVIQEVLSNMLKKFGYTVVCKENGKDAVCYASSENRARRHLTAMIFDLTVPDGMGGKEAVAEIRKFEKDIPVFVASGYAEDPVMKNPSFYGFTASLCKPFTQIELSEVFETYITNRTQ